MEGGRDEERDESVEGWRQEGREGRKEGLRERDVRQRLRRFARKEEFKKREKKIHHRMSSQLNQDASSIYTLHITLTAMQIYKVEVDVLQRYLTEYWIET